jgi:hypothetical protein
MHKTLWFQVTLTSAAFIALIVGLNAAIIVYSYRLQDERVAAEARERQQIPSKGPEEGTGLSLKMGRPRD